MSRKKKKYMAEIQKMDHVFDSGEEVKGKWADYFGNDNPIVLELGCGHGTYTTELAKMHPHKNYIGVDMKGPRMWTGIKTALGEELKNVGFVRTNINKLPDFFAPDEVSEIWITFPDPHPKPCRWKKRLSSAWFLLIYQQVLKAGGIIHFKTDNDALYQFTLDTISALHLPIKKKVDHVDSSGNGDPELAIATFYEEAHRRAGLTIQYVAFSLGSKTLGPEAIVQAAPPRP